VIRHVLVEIEVAGEGDVRRHQQRVAVGLGLRRRAGADVAAGARPVHHHDGLAARLLQLAGIVARDQVGAAAGSKPGDDRDLLVGIVALRRCRRGERREQTGRGRQSDKHAC
jgi:hypothetical protein